MEVSVAQPMARPGRLRREAAADLVLALRAGLEPLEAFADAVLDALVVASLEVQAVEVGAAAPVAAVERRAAAKADRRGDRRALMAREHDEQVLRHRRGDCRRRSRDSNTARGRAARTCARRTRRSRPTRPASARRRAGARTRSRPLRRAGARACAFLRFVGAEPRQELVEVRVAVVVPSGIDSSCASGSRRARALARSGSVGNSTCSDDAPSSSARAAGGVEQLRRRRSRRPAPARPAGAGRSPA